MPDKSIDYEAIARLIKEYQEIAFNLRGKLINAAINLELQIDDFIVQYYCEKSPKKIKDDFRRECINPLFVGQFFKGS